MVIKKAEAIVVYRNQVSDRIDKLFGAFSHKATILHEKNLRRMAVEIHEARKMTVSNLENEYRTTNRGLAKRYSEAKTPEWKEFYRRMMDVNDCKMIEKMYVARKQE